MPNLKIKVLCEKNLSLNLCPEFVFFHLYCYPVICTQLIIVTEAENTWFKNVFLYTFKFHVHLNFSDFEDKNS